MKRALVCVFLSVSCLVSTARAAIYQWSAKVGEEAGGQNKNQRVYLWIPEDCKRIRGLILDMQNVAENYNIDQPCVREVCRQERIGILWVSADREATMFPQAAFCSDWGWMAGLGPEVNKAYEEATAALRKPDRDVSPEKKAELRQQLASWRARLIPQAEREFTTILKSMAEISGYPEVEYAPVLTIGQSMSGLLCWYMPFWHPERMWGSMPMKTGVRGLPPAERPEATMHGVPLLYLNQIAPEGPDGHSDPRNCALGARKDTGNLVGQAFDWGGHHIDMLPGIDQMLALFVKKASRYRLADEIPEGHIPTLKPLTAAQGWLAASPLESTQFPMAPEPLYQGDKDRAFWYFDKEMAEAAMSFRAENRKKKPQFVTLLDKNRKLLNPVEGFFGSVTIPRDDLAEDDGYTYRLTPAFFDKGIENEKVTDKPVGHASNGSPVILSPQAGNMVALTQNVFRYRRFHRGRHGHTWFVIHHPGDAEYSRISQPAGMWAPEEERKGREQTIDFPEIPSVPVGTKEIQLNATSSVPGQVVEYYVVSGPAELTGNLPDRDGYYPKYTGNTLRLTPIPPNAKYPIKVIVAAYQLGRSKEPFVQGAREVMREFCIGSP